VVNPLAWLIMLSLVLTLAACSVMDPKETKEFKIADVNLKLGMGYLEQNRLDDALRVLLKALRAKSDYGDVHTVLAVVYDRLYKYDEAEDHYTSAVSLQPEKVDVYNNYGGFLCRQGNFEDAEYYFKKALEFRRNDIREQVYENAGICAAQVPDLKKAEEYFRKALQINAELPKSLLGMANIMFSKQRYLSVRAYLQRFEAVSQPNPQSLLLGIQAERKLGDAKAEQRYASSLRAGFPKSREFNQWLNETSQGDTTP